MDFQFSKVFVKTSTLVLPSSPIFGVRNHALPELFKVRNNSFEKNSIS